MFIIYRVDQKTFKACQIGIVETRATAQDRVNAVNHELKRDRMHKRLHAHYTELVKENK